MSNGREGGSTLSRPSRVPGALVLVAGLRSPVRDEVLGNLRDGGYEVLLVEALGEAVARAADRDQDLVILVAPDPRDVAEACLALRTRFHNPVLVVFADETSGATIIALDAGADDVMFAPVSASEFIARVEVALRYRHALTALASDDVLEVGGLRIDLVRRAAVINGESVELSPNEFHLLSVLARAAGNAVSAVAIADQIWPDHESESLNRLRICVTRLRKLLAGHVGAPLIFAERGVGYSMVLTPPED